MHKSVRRFVLALSGVFTLAAAAPVLAQDDLLARIKSNKEITVATEARYAPFEYVDNGKIVGYDADLMA
ncbi:MAG: transporter substrate-binding domain-containing protein, partial [Paraburkholderia tropica]